MAKRNDDPYKSEQTTLRRNKRGALSTRIPASGSTVPGGSSIHRSGRRKLNRAIHEGKAILVRESDGVALRAATFDEITASWKSGGRILVKNVMDDDGVSWGTTCIIRQYAQDPTQSFDNKPRLVKTKRKGKR